MRATRPRIPEKECSKQRPEEGASPRSSKSSKKYRYVFSDKGRETGRRAVGAADSEGLKCC